ncbi:MAG: hypothetical protein LBR36_09750, partial [Bacteroidales bacterium]|nr:hypothetical protein [Bacteroidales bacterium]
MTYKRAIYVFKASITMLVLGVLFLNSTQIFSQTSQRYYWVGGGVDNNWGNISNWSSSSGGIASAGITQAPANVNTCIFDANSFLNGDSTIDITGAVQCDSLLFLNATHKAKLVFAGNASLSIYGSLELQAGMRFDNNYQFNFNSNRPNESIRTNGVNMVSVYPYYT